MSPKTSTAKTNRPQLSSLFNKCIKSSKQSNVGVCVTVCVCLKNSSHSQSILFTATKRKTTQKSASGFTADPHKTNQTRKSNWNISVCIHSSVKVIIYNIYNGYSRYRRSVSSQSGLQRRCYAEFCVLTEKCMHLTGAHAAKGKTTRHCNDF